MLNWFCVCAVVVGGKGTNKKTTLYVGGLEENVNEAILHSAFIPFGDIKDVNIPLDNTTGKHRGFGFVEYENAEVISFLSMRSLAALIPHMKRQKSSIEMIGQDSADAIDNMHNAELYGRVLRCNYAQPMKIKGGDKGFSHQPVWADADDWYERAEAEQELEKLSEEQEKKAQAEKLKAGQLVKDPMEAAEEAAIAGR